MKIVAYSTSDQVLGGCIWVAFIDHGAGDFHPVHFTGPTESGVRETAAKWWAAELEAERKRREPKPRKTHASPDPEPSLQAQSQADRSLLA